MNSHGEYKPPGLSQWTGSAINATIALDQPGNISFTNLDEISGRVLVRATKSVDISTIVVKLEGESRTRLLNPGTGTPNEKPRPQLEYHKILYRVQTVFPPADLLEGRVAPPTKAAFTLPYGQHEYPFSFKIPFNNACNSEQHTGAFSSFLATSGLEIARSSGQHVKKTLPPTLTGFPGEAEIRYFVKVTVARQSFFKENPRAYVPFTFFPIEPPRPRLSGAETYARQRHSFAASPKEDSIKLKKKSIFGKQSEIAPSLETNDAPQISVDARLPEPAILTCNNSVPLRIIVKRLSNFKGSLYVHSLQIALIGYTKVRAHDVFRTESNSWIVVSKSNMKLAAGGTSDPSGSEFVVDDSLWRNQALPNTIAPSFETCNISRSYQLDIRIGISYESDLGGALHLRKGKSSLLPQSTMLPLRLATVVYSGIAPPAELLARMSERKKMAVNVPEKAASANLGAESHVPTPLVVDQSAMQSNAIPPTPLDDVPTVARTEDAGNAAPPLYSEAPPSYEDAIASDIRPVEAPRPAYAPPNTGEDEVLRRDEKRGWGTQ